MPADPQSATPSPNLPEARLHRRHGTWFIWLIPVVAAVISAWLGWRAISERGPRVTIAFASAEGLTAGQTKIRHKSVELGTVSSIDLAPDLSRVVVRADMKREAAPRLTENARFWVVRPRLSAGNISGLDTLLSGSYIEMDPGKPGATEQLAFTALDEPPAVRSDEPGASFTLTAGRLGSISSGSPVFYRDVVVGEVLGYDLPSDDASGTKPLTVHLFIRAPYDRLVHRETHFWNVSGVSLDLGAQGFTVRLESLQAALLGGIAFGTPRSVGPPAPPEPGAVFELYDSAASAEAAGFRQRIPFVTYFEGSVRGLAPGAAVEMFGIPIGQVTDVALRFDPDSGASRVAVRFEIQPRRVLTPEQMDVNNPLDVTRMLVARGMRVQLHNANLITGQMVLALEFFPHAAGAPVGREGDAIVVPNVAGGLDSLSSGLTDIVGRLQAIPFDDIGRNLNAALAGAAAVAAGPELKQSLRALAATLASAQSVLGRFDSDASPAIRRLPEIAQSLQTAIDRFGRLAGSADAGYGQNSSFQRDLTRLMEQLTDAARSIRLLADFLDQHPEALVRGRTGRASE